MYKEFETYICDEKLFQPTDRILVATSGGIDSMVMLDCLLYHRYHVEVAHVNYSLRGTDSDLDQELIMQFCQKHNIPCHVHLTPLKETLASENHNLQALARQIRYDFFKKIIAQNALNCIAVAHHLDDRIENYFISSLRGTGLRGVTSMKNKTDLVVRPLLFTTREQIVQHAKSHNIPYREDASNNESKYQRNFIRNKIIPSIKTKIPDYQSRMSTTLRNLDADGLLLARLIAEKKSKLITQNKESIHLKIEYSSTKFVDVNLYFHILQEYGCNMDQVQTILNASTGAKITTEHYEMLKNRAEIVIRPIDDISSNTIMTIDSDLHVLIDHVKLSKQAKSTSDLQSNTLCVDFGLLTFPLTLRTWLPGDHFHPFGLKGKTKKVKDFLTNKKLNQFDKQNTLVLCNNNNIICIVGQEIDYHYRIQDTTETMLCIQVI